MTVIGTLSLFSFGHNHDLLKEIHCGLLAEHRNLTMSYKIQINNFASIGNVNRMIIAFANATGV